MAILETANIEQGMPTVEQARLRLLQALRGAKARRARAVKVIHGYGSSGVGGTLRGEMQKALAAHRRSGLIRHFVSGDKWSIFTPEGRRALELVPELKGDRDLDRGNPGITIVIL
ncbi:MULTISPECIES: Smr/MutS family protein [unclassified Carboxydocella]|uniref:Smr/MutS family protein n=1 Tax=unclassified Carboxydocella TaxID=2685367 RepID=UPI0009AC7BA1|nr:MULTISPECIES: Smr/MutS family protein [unclassified Carboxydocella]GAW29262.1 putative uncharacterized protein [Carboxydocella sp. ULO1]GAW30935.1 putative uncharacterized protein [Carboxydocella sp. JDF658]